MPIYEFRCANGECEKHGKSLEYLVPTMGGSPDRCDYCEQPTLERASQFHRVSIGSVGGSKSSGNSKSSKGGVEVLASAIIPCPCGKGVTEIRVCREKSQ